MFWDVTLWRLHYPEDNILYKEMKTWFVNLNQRELLLGECLVRTYVGFQKIPVNFLNVMNFSTSEFHLIVLTHDESVDGQLVACRCEEEREFV
jgi:hypothetical protein